MTLKVIYSIARAFTLAERAKKLQTQVSRLQAIGQNDRGNLVENLVIKELIKSRLNQGLDPQ